MDEIQVDEKRVDVDVMGGILENDGTDMIDRLEVLSNINTNTFSSRFSSSSNTIIRKMLVPIADTLFPVMNRGTGTLIPLMDSG